jgi:hypothetical protein
MTDKIFQVKITINDSEPEIWRKILIPGNVRLPSLHRIIQIAFGWTNSHLHQFIKDDEYYTVRYPNDDTWYELDNIDYNKGKTCLSDLISAEKESIVYEYDFGDGWMHEIFIEKVLPADPSVKYPVCLEGQRSGPPEDCGGISGYEELLEVLKDPDHEEYEHYATWVGDYFKPEYFNMERVNAIFKRSKFHAGKNKRRD